ncbi:MAG: VTC domain-containing protein [bacterium]|nr:VTC domain-containing protein [bacterium]
MITFANLRKGASDPDRKEKIRKTMKIDDFCSWSEKKLEKRISKVKLRPHAVCQYYRQHYISDKEKDLRLTIDKNVRYGYFDPINGFSWIGNDGSVRIEIKASKESMNSETYQELLKILQSKNYLNVISKKNQIYNFLKDLRFKYVNKLINELPEYEIESKISISDNDPWMVLFKIKDALDNGFDKNLDLSYYPHVECTSRVYYYFQKLVDPQIDEVIKLSFKINKFRLIYKDEAKFIKDSYHLGCIIKRKEIKNPWFNFNVSNSKKVLKIIENKLGSFTRSDYLQRNRLAIWPLNNVSGRLYRIGIDKCTSNSGVDYQMEIEYEGRIKGEWKISKNTEKEISSELAHLTNTVFNLLNKDKPTAAPTQETKLDILNYRKR